MPAPAIKAIIVAAPRIMAVYSAVSTIVNDIITVKNHLNTLREQSQQFWGSTTNADSSVFNQRMQELDNDIQIMLKTLNDYTEILQRSAREYERTQQNAHNDASQLRSPRNF